MLLFALAAAVILLNFVRTWVERRRANPAGLPYPPGPKPRPIIGNLFDMPPEYYWLTYAEWAKTYGDILHVKVFGQHIILLNSLEACIDLLEKRSAIYSDRPRLPMMNELMGFTWAFSLMPYGSCWRRHRKVFHQYFYPNAVANYVPKQLAEARKTLLRLDERPADFMDHIRLYFAASILNIVYGIKVDETTNQEFVHYGETVMEGATIAGVPGAFLVDMLPILTYVPAWVPGASFQKFAKYYRSFMPKLVDTPYAFAKQEMASHPDHQSIVADIHKHLKNADVANEEEELLAKNTTALAYAAGADTTVSTLQLFFLAMRLHPEVQAKAQAQIDEVVGNDRLPDFSDIQRLPYIQAIVKELFRWQPITPLALAHRVITDDFYRGYHIPKGALIMGNTWSILHNEKAYPDPESFFPERFLREDGAVDPNVLDPSVASFGFGRRICPGRHLAENGALIMVVSILAVFNIRPSRREGASVASDQRPAGKHLMTSGLIAHPLPFECSIEPRSPDASALVRRSEQV